MEPESNYLAKAKQLTPEESRNTDKPKSKSDPQFLKLQKVNFNCPLKHSSMFICKSYSLDYFTKYPIYIPTNSLIKKHLFQ